MKLSIIVPVYNVLPYIRRCLDSLVNQSFEDYEIILIDDGSTDGTGQLLEEYRERYPEKILLKRVENGGQGRARNLAIDMARCDFLGFIDSDDWIDPDMYRIMYETAAAGGADIVVCDWLAVYGDGREAVLPACVQEHWLSSAGSACNKIFRRELVGDVRFPQGLWYEDFYFSAMLLLKSSRTEYVSRPLYVYRQSQDSTMRNNNAAKNLDILTIMDMLAEYMLPNGFRDEYEFFLINHVLLDTISRVSRQAAADKGQVLSRLRSYVRERIPRLSACESYRRESRKRRIVMAMNYHGLNAAADFLMKLKARLR